MATVEDFTRGLAELIDAAVTRQATSAAALARVAGISENSIANWRGGVIPQEGQLAALLTACGVLRDQVNAWLAARGRIVRARTVQRRIEDLDRALADSNERLAAAESRVVELEQRVE